MRIKPVSGGTQNRVHSMSKYRVSLAAKTLGRVKTAALLYSQWQLLPRENRWHNVIGGSYDSALT